MLFETKSEYTFPTCRRRKSAKRIDTISQEYLSLLKTFLSNTASSFAHWYTIGLHEISRRLVIDSESQWVPDVYLIRSKWNKEKDRKIEAIGIQNETLFCLKNKTKQKTRKKTPRLLPPSCLQNPSVWLNTKVLFNRCIAHSGKNPDCTASNPLLPRTRVNMHNPSCSHPAERSAGTHWAEKTWMQPWHSSSQPSPPKCWAVTVLGVEGHTSGTQWYRMALGQSCEFEKRAKERNLDSVVIITTMPAGFSNPICEGFWAAKWSKPLQSYRNQWVEWAPITLWIQMNVLPHRVNAEWHRDLLPHKGRTDGWHRQSHSPEGGWSYWEPHRQIYEREREQCHRWRYLLFFLPVSPSTLFFMLTLFFYLHLAAIT